MTDPTVAEKVGFDKSLSLAAAKAALSRAEGGGSFPG